MERKKKLTPLKAIRKKCVDCCAGSVREVRLCAVTDCHLYPYRLGHNPARKGVGGSSLARGRFESKNAQ